MATANIILRRLLRIAGIAALAVLGVLIVVLGLFMLAPVRSGVLNRAVAKAKAHLPGDFTVTHASWPSVGAIGFREVLWTANGDTLAAADTLTLEMNLKSLFHRDIHARRLVATGVTLDLPVLLAAFPPSAKTAPAAPSRKKTSRFPRRGVLPGVPSVAAEEIVLRVHRARFTPGWTIVESELEGGCDLSPDTGPRLTLTRLVACSLERKIEVQATPFHFDGRAETMSGDFTARLDSLGTLTVHVASSSRDSVRLVATVEPEGNGSPLRIDVRGRLSWDNQRLQSCVFHSDLLVPGTNELARWPDPIRKATATLSPLPPISLSMEGALSLRPDFLVRGHLHATPTGWLEGLEVTGSYGDAGIEVDTLRVSLPGLQLAASGRRTEKNVTALADARASDARWLKVVMPRFDLPESLVANLHLAMDGPRSEPAVRIELAGGFRKNALAVKDLTVSGSFPEGLGRAGAVNVRGVYRDLRVSTRAALVPKLPLLATVSPIRIEDLAAPSGAPSTVPRGDGTVRYDGASRRLSVNSVCVFGDWGTGHVDAKMVERSGDAALTWEFSALPALLHRVMTLPDSTWRALDHRWREDGPFTLSARSRFSGKHVSGQADFNFPGPSTLRALLPRGSRVDDLGPFCGRIEASADSMWAATVDLSATSWLESSPLRMEGSRSGLAVDSLQLGMEGWTLSASGRRENDNWSGRGTLELRNAETIRRFVPSMTARDSCTMSVLAEVHGRDPDLSLQFTGAGRYHNMRLQRAKGQMSRSGGRLDMDVSAIGLDLGTSLKLDRLSAGLATQTDGKETVRFECAGPTLAFATRGVMDRRNGLTAAVDTLGLTLSDKDLHTTKAFLIEARKHGDGFRFEDVDLEGTMGSVKGHGELRSGGSELDVRVALDLEGLSPPSPLVSAWWPERLDASIVNEGTEAIAARASVHGLRLEGRKDYVLDITARGETRGLTAEAHLRDAEKDVLVADYFSPGLWQLYPLRIEMKPHLVEARATLHAFPIPWQDLGLDNSQIWPGTVTGNLYINHDEAGPYAREDFEITLTSPDPKERPIHLASQGIWMVSSGQIDRVSENQTVPLSEAIEARVRELTTPALVASFTVSRDTNVQLSGSLFSRFRPRPDGGFEIDPENGLDLTASAPRFDLATLRPFLPSGYSLSGHLRLDARLSGSPRNPALSGTVDAPGIAFLMNAGGRVEAKGKLEYSGTLQTPKVQGRIDIKNGVIPIPEEPRKLHAVSGDALLWQSGKGIVADSMLSAATETKPASADSVGKFRPVYDLQIVVPSGFWIRGRNLNVELEGDLRLRQEHGLPTVVGTLEARQGTLNFLGRSFTLERGKVQFYGEDEINPGLDIRLTAKVSSTNVYVSMSGTLTEPKLELTSSPSMSEGDIMSLLVMGKTSDDLNGDQAQLVAQRAAAVAATYGAAELQKKMAGPLGVDMISLNPGGGPEGENSLVVGKYLSPRALLKYEQALDSAAGFFVTLEYTLTQTITLQTIAGTWQSGAEISWSKDY